MNLILIDRNVVSVIKQKNLKRNLSLKRRVALRKIDKTDNYISPLLSIIEGQSGFQEDQEACRATLVKETRVLKNFLKYAQTDCSFLEDHADHFSSIFSGDVEEKWGNYLQFIIEMQKLLHQPIKKELRAKYKNEIFQTALKYNIPKTHPVVICSISVLYRCQETHKILKPKKLECVEMQEKNAYNTLSDIMVLSRMVTILNAMQAEEKNFNVSFFTFDEGLNFFLEKISVSKTSAETKGGKVSILTEISVDKKLFPEMSAECYEETMAFLKEQ